jgi:signal transduction histidine kinase/ligand-binding sensor domain-containing protein
MGWRAIWIVFAALPLLLEAERPPIRAYTTADGLASDRIDGIVADSRGFLWFCTAEGLSRFDGYRFVNYGVEEGLPNRAVYSVLETRAGDFFVGTAGGLSRIIKGAQFANYSVNSAPAKNAIVAMWESHAGKILLATPREVFEWTGPQLFRQRPQRPGPILIQTLIEDSYGELIVGTSNDVTVYGPGGTVQRFTPNDGLPGAWTEALLLDRNQRLWVGLRGGLALLVRGADGRWSLSKTYTTESGLAGDGVAALLEASDGTLWIATNQGISRMRASGSDQPAFDNLTRAQGLIDRAISALAEDRAGNIWAGTAGAGVMRFDRFGFQTYHEPDGLGSDFVWSVFENRAREIVAVTSSSGQTRRAVSAFDGKRFHPASAGPLASQASWGWNQVLLESRTGEWWAATDNGLCRFASTKNASQNGAGSATCYSYGTVFRIFEDSRGGIWASAQSNPIELGSRLMRWDPAAKTLVNFPAPRVAGEGFPNGYADDLASAFAEDRHGNIWMGLWSGDVYRYNGREFQRFGKSDGVPPGVIFALLASGSDLWIGSNGGGLGRIRDPGAEHPRIERYSMTQGLASNIVYCLVDDAQGRIYAGTAKGVDRLDPSTGHIRHFSSADGLARGELMSAVRDRNGSLWFATKQGLSRLIPEADHPPIAPRILITDLRIGNTIHPVSQRGETQITQLELKPSENQMQIEFTGIDYEPGDILRYSYKLDNADAQWSAPSAQRSVNYASLPSGHFRFLVKVITAEGVESAEPAEVEFTVLPPIWRRWWFQALAVLVIAATVFGAHRYRVAQMVNVERMRTAIATDLHDDIGAGLSQIAILTEVARVSGNGKERTGEPLERVAALARELVDSMSDIVWSIRSEPHGTDSLIRRMREFALDLLVSQKIDFELRVPHPENDVQLSLEMRRHLFLMFRECIHNAARHSNCTAVVAALKVENRELVLTVEDNGDGLKSDKKPSGDVGGTGIPGMRRRAEALGGSLQVNSTPGKGCTVAIRLPTRQGPFANRV